MRRWCLMTLALLTLGAATLPAQIPTVYRIAVSGTVENGLAPYVARGLREAEAAGAAAVYLDIDTPGGRIDAAERISDAVRASHHPCLRLRESSRLQRRRAHRPFRLPHLHAPGRRARRGYAGGWPGRQGLGEDGVGHARRIPRPGGGAGPRSEDRRGDGGRRPGDPWRGQGGPASDAQHRRGGQAGLRQGTGGERGRPAPGNRPPGRARRHRGPQLGRAGRPVRDQSPRGSSLPARSASWDWCSRSSTGRSASGGC